MTLKMGKKTEENERERKKNKQKRNADELLT